MDLLKKQMFKMDLLEYELSLFEFKNKFIVKVNIPKGLHLENEEKFNEFLKNINDLFTYIDKRFVYIGSEYQIVKNEFYLEVYYPKNSMSKGDNEFIVSDTEIGKNLISVELIKEDYNNYEIEINMLSPTVIFNNEELSLWKFDKSIVSNFLKNELNQIFNS